MNDIVVGVDPSDTARRAAEKAARLAAAMGVNLHLVTCVKRDGGRNVGVGGDSWNVDPLTEAEAFLKVLARQLPHDRITTMAGFDGPAETMLAEAERLGAGMIVVGNRRVQGVSRVLGSIAGEVSKHATCDVLIANTIATD